MAELAPFLHTIIAQESKEYWKMGKQAGLKD